MADQRFAAGGGIAALVGLVCGFSDFGSALIYVPLMSTRYAVALLSAILAMLLFDRLLQP
jgi:uncharacterized protein